jgi:thiol-disulfide isomerase/thioredoxin
MKNSFNINYITLQVILMVLVILVAVFFIVTNKTNNVSREHLDNNKDAYVLFYAPQWCGWSKKIEPYWDKMVNDYSSNGRLFDFYKVDADNNRELCRKYNITGYPTIKYIKTNGIAHEFIVHEYNDELVNKMYTFAMNLIT